ncbi:MAG TPA: LptF/LptG family permease [Planctomycetota bacterium]
MILARAYLREILQHLALVLGGMLFLVSLGAAVQAASRGAGAPLWIPVMLVPLAVGNTLPFLLPISLQVAVVLAYGRMAADGEERALRAAGVHPGRLLGPALVAGILIAATSYPLASMGLPDLYSRMRALSWRLRFAALENNDPSSSELHFQGMHMLWRDRDDHGVFHDVLLHLRGSEALAVYPGDPGAGERRRSAAEDRDEPPPDTLESTLRVRADVARMQARDGVLQLRMEGMRTFESDADGGWRYRSPGTSTLRIPLENLDRPAKSLKPNDFRSSELRGQIVRLAEERKGLGARPREQRRIEEIDAASGRFRMELWRRLAMAVSAVPLAVLGALLGWRLRRSGVLAGFAASFAAVLGVFFPLHWMGDALQRSGTLDALPAAWLPVFGLVLLLLVLRALPSRN